MNNGSWKTAGIKEISTSGQDAERARPGAAQDRPQVPDPRVLEHPERRRFTVDYKARIVREADACAQHGQIGALLRREGLYSSQLSTWRRAYREGALSALRDDKRGRKRVKHPLEKENESLKKDNARLGRQLSQAEAVIDIQKKLSEILGVPLTGIENKGDE